MGILIVIVWVKGQVMLLILLNLVLDRNYVGRN